MAVIQKLDDEPNDVTGLTPAELKLRFDQAAIWLKDYINNTLIPALSSNSSSGGTGASNIGAAVSNFSGATVQAVLNAFNDALVDRYTKSQTNSYISQATNSLVASVSVDNATGVITVTKKDGTRQTFDTALEKVPASMDLVESSGATYLVITNQDGSKTKTDVSRLIKQYVFRDSTELDFSTTTSGGVVTVTASIRPSSIGLDRFAPEVTQKLEEYNTASKASADEARGSANSASTASSLANDAALRAQNSLSQAQNSASNASDSATQASQSASSAAASAQSAQSSARQAQEAAANAQYAQSQAEQWSRTSKQIIPANVSFELVEGGQAHPMGSTTVQLIFDGYAFCLLGDYTFNFSSQVQLRTFSVYISPVTGYEWAPPLTSDGYISVVQFAYSSYGTTSYPVSLPRGIFSSGAERTFDGLNTKAYTNTITICGGLLGEGRVIQ